MNEAEFNAEVRELNKKYLTLFNEIPCITDYSCSRDEFIKAMRLSVESGSSIDHFVPKYI